MEELDWSTGRILDKLVETGLDQRTLVLWTSDNGAPLAADVESPARGSNQPLHGRGYTTAEGAFRVPAIAWWPGTIPAGSVSNELMSMIDLLPTLAALSGTSVRPGRAIDGLDVSDALVGRGSARSPRETLYYYQQDELQAIRSGPWKLFVPLESPGSRHPHFGIHPSDQPLLFNLAEDPASRIDLASKRPGVVEQLLEIASKARSELGDRGVAGKGQRPAGRVESPRAAVLGR